MLHTITIETKDETEFGQIKDLAKNLGVPFRESHQKLLSKEEQLQLLNQLSWEGDETGDELNAMIYGARRSSLRDVEL
ncbi:hypothetical protein MUK70_26490 [Dyadobacter chenwenxiniae]|uniref:Uncharacterized protein n=1 Tax=Dyadobacter chenwenxiniae TaxID=2906456 RepID=A0A9X1PPU6_9BACT|nr:hypothetical protein [Dyadobacter chenwenxiniae]MCF0064219.1 hypothetical protein [Dyadobacter chenwenxiniae]UON82565.1 hypothetical protein MUK70_26490 [Dyadobacter chenwenxiniae]